MKTVYLLTANKGKALAAEKAFSKLCIEVKAIKSDIPEIQADSSLEIARHAALIAAKELNAPVIREDHSMFINALNNFPGPYIAYFDYNMPVEKLLKMMEGEADRNGYFELAAVYATPEGKTKEYVYRVPVEIATEKKGESNNWDKVIRHPGSSTTFAETNEINNLDVWNRNFARIAEDLSREF